MKTWNEYTQRSPIREARMSDKEFKETREKYHQNWLSFIKDNGIFPSSVKFEDGIQTREWVYTATADIEIDGGKLIARISYDAKGYLVMDLSGVVSAHFISNDIIAYVALNNKARLSSFIRDAKTHLENCINSLSRDLKSALIDN